MAKRYSKKLLSSESLAESTPANGGKRYQSNKSMMSDLSVQKILMESGYASLVNIIYRDKLEYVKAVNKNGHVVFIVIDFDAYSGHGEGDMHVESYNVTIVPLETKMSALECYGFDVCGVAFDCKDGLCMVHHGVDGLQSNERSFRISNNTGVLPDNPIPYPIVRLSEVRQHPEHVESLVDRATRRIRNEMVDHAMKMFSRLDQSLEESQSRIVDYGKLVSTTYKKLSLKLDELEKYNYESTNGEEQYVIRYNLRVRNEEVIRFAHELNKVIALQGYVDSINNVLESSKVTLNNAILPLDYDIEPE